MISIEDYLAFVDDALDGMVSIVSELGDERANRRPDIPGANSPYIILTHCLGVMEYGDHPGPAAGALGAEHSHEARSPWTVNRHLSRCLVAWGNGAAGQPGHAGRRRRAA